MGLKIENGFKIFSEYPDLEFLCIESDRVEDCIDYAIKKNKNYFLVSRFHGYKSNNIDFISDCKEFVEGLFIDANSINIEPVHTLGKLKFLLLYDNKKQSLNLGFFPFLEELRFTWHSDVIGLIHLNNLRKLMIDKYQPSKYQNFTELGTIKNLESLDIRRSNITSFKGVEQLIRLNSLEAFMLNELEQIDYLESLGNSLKYLEFKECKGLKNLDYVSNVESLETLKFIECSNTPTIAFVKDMLKLRNLVFIRTKIIDGDLSPLLQCKLKYISFTDYKHYSHSLEEIRRLLNL